MSNYKSFLPSTVIRDYGYSDSHPLHTGDFAHAPHVESDSEDDFNRSRTIDDEDYSSEGEEADEEDDDDYDDDDDVDSNNGNQLKDEINRKARALFDFIPENDNEVSLTEGQIIWISYRHGQGWLVAEDPETGENGLVPEEYVEIFHEQIGVGQQGLNDEEEEAGDVAKPFLPEILREEGGSYASDSSDWVDTDDAEDKEKSIQEQQPQKKQSEDIFTEVTEKVNSVTI
ncbi:NAP1-binding protein 2 [Spathaspora sp. JA1]|nr:NAP1-binding protein 2 [Spathaspora sp. JA1]